MPVTGWMLLCLYSSAAFCCLIEAGIPRNAGAAPGRGGGNVLQKVEEEKASISIRFQTLGCVCVCLFVWGVFGVRFVLFLPGWREMVKAEFGRGLSKHKQLCM